MFKGQTESDVVVLDALRTPLGRGKNGGAFSSLHPVDLLATTIRGLVERNNVDPLLISDVIGGCVSQVGEQTFNLTRHAVLAAGLPEQVPAVTIDRQCGSSQQAVHFGAQGIVAGEYDLVVACGVESMSRVPLGSAWADHDPFGHGVASRYPPGLIPQGVAAERIAGKWAISREEMDSFSVESHRRAAQATDSGGFDSEILPVSVVGEDGMIAEVTADEGIRRDSTLERLAQLSPAFEDPVQSQRFPEITWQVTAGNSSQLTDGAAAVLLSSRKRARELGLTPRATIRAMAVVGDDPLMMLTGVIPATNAVLQKAEMTLEDIDLFEVNEAFASVVLAWQREFGPDLESVNVNGGAIALGHPVGATGARLLATLVNALEASGLRFGLQTVCEGGGQANALVLELG